MLVFPTMVYYFFGICFSSWTPEFTAKKAESDRSDGFMHLRGCDPIKIWLSLLLETAKSPSSMIR